MRKSKISKELIEELATLHSKGLPIKYCCDNVGIVKQTYYNWYNRGKEGDQSNGGLYILLYDSMRKARAKCIQHLVNKIWEDPKPQTLIFMLRVLDPQTFNISHKVDSTQQSYYRLEKLFEKERIKKIANEQEE